MWVRWRACRSYGRRCTWCGRRRASWVARRATGGADRRCGWGGSVRRCWPWDGARGYGGGGMGALPGAGAVSGLTESSGACAGGAARTGTHQGSGFGAIRHHGVRGAQWEAWGWAGCSSGTGAATAFFASAAGGLALVLAWPIMARGFASRGRGKLAARRNSVHLKPVYLIGTMRTRLPLAALGVALLAACGAPHPTGGGSPSQPPGCGVRSAVQLGAG